ncbi:putative glycerol-3-phosphate acyltransferase [Methyloligella halotolerans]|uniref:Glycerol-3-phosphate acyltransferase n=1 Tax=Methyloligella halotolerans TaxID=1177755 RepID=A0A1E2S1Q4_9HYPH|nr:glycerol-3-phosphate 1-O-acyltransferase PlsY [Methyloligella halotolerans]ODA68374.1 putative glycerol-3-phosphate acyltransferase [Methyloligella halotolerans]
MTEISWSLALVYAAAFFGGYLCGSIPFGLILTRAAGLGDLRQIGSGNIGTTNVLRTGNKWLTAATLAGDVLKGTIPVLLAMYFLGPIPAIVAGIGAFLGHLAPIWLGFRGGKGVATYIGVLLGLYWPAALLFCAVWLLIAFTTRYSSLSALVAALVTPAVLAYTASPPLVIASVVLSVLLILRHQGNIARLIRGEETRIGQR